MENCGSKSEHQLALVVVYRLHEGAMHAFLSLATAHAATVLQENPGCLRYDVVASPASDTVVFYEVYASPMAHAQHLQSSQLGAFRESRVPLVMDWHEHRGTIVLPSTRGAGHA